MVSLGCRSAVLTSLLLTLAAAPGCTSGNVPVEASPPTQTAAPAPSQTAHDSPSPAVVIDQRTAEQVLKDIARKVPSVTLVRTYTEDNDPNKLLGRPNGYTSKVAFADSRLNLSHIEDQTLDEDAIDRGGSVEVFPDEQGAQARADYIQSMLKSTGFGAEYDYVKGSVLLRVTGDLTPTKAKAYESSLG